MTEKVEKSENIVFYNGTRIELPGAEEKYYWPLSFIGTFIGTEDFDAAWNEAEQANYYGE